MDRPVNIIIPTYNRPKFLNNLLMDIYESNENHLFNVYVVDDNSNISYCDVVSKYEKYTNFTYQKKNKNEGKNRAIFDVMINLKEDDYILVIDDKDRFIFSLSKLTTRKILNDQIIGFNLYNENGVLQGSKELLENTTMYDYYFKNHFIGDKLWIFRLAQIDLKEMRKSFVDGELAYEDTIWVHYLWYCKIIEVISDHHINYEYLENGVSKNIESIQKQNPLTYLYVLTKYFEHTSNFWYKYQYYYNIKKNMKNIRKKKYVVKPLFVWKYEFTYRILYIPHVISKLVHSFTKKH